jgi:class 3 adenylate cyclase/tetratricopeptide (TPR) repeat protein
VKSFAEWLREAGLERYAAVFAENDIDFGNARTLSEADLRELGLTLGHRKNFLAALAALETSIPARPGESSTAAPAAGGAPPTGQTSSREAGERRQLTVLFCDLVGFTELATRLDPELLEGVMRSYEDACAVCISRYEGYVFQRLGDGIVAFFGYPLAHEGEAERAIRAGLEIIEALPKLDVPAAGRLRVRIGIATGVVVVSTAGKGATGETMNLASRLQGVAQPGHIVIAERTRQLAGGTFDYEDLGAQSLKGIAQPMPAWRISGLSRAESRFDAATLHGLTPLVGRAQETALLLERWHLAQEGEGQTVLLSGEPGIGKSRILRALGDALGERVSTVLRCQCSPFHVNSAFYPIIDTLERSLRFTREEPAGSRLDKLEALMIGQHGRPLLDASVMALLLSIPTEGRYKPLGMTPQRQKEETIRAIVDLVEAIARAQPALMLFEDAHWADPTTLEVMGLLIDRLRGFPLLLVVTHRPEFEPPWERHLHVAAITLSRLSRAQSASLVSHVAPKPLPPDLIDQIVEKTDGVPLFLEELTKAVLESDLVREAGDRYEHSGSVASVAIPATLRDSLMARLDRLIPVKEIAQIGAALGREFSYEMLAAIARRAGAELDDALERLTRSGLVFRRGTPPDTTYVFKHALVQDAAYESLLVRTRQELHGKIGRVLERQFPATAQSQPELLAHHFTAAGMIEAAIAYWRAAGELASQRLALNEAIAHLTRGLELVAALPASAERDEKELVLRVLLGNAWMALRGWAFAEAETHFRPAYKLAKSLDHRGSYLPVLGGLWNIDLTQGRIAESLKWAEEHLELGETLADIDLKVAGHLFSRNSHLFLGHLEVAQQHGERLVALYDPERARQIMRLVHYDMLTSHGVYGAPCLWLLGYPDRALRLHKTTDARSREFDQPINLCYALTMGSWIFHLRREPDRLLAYVEEGIDLARAHSLPFFSEVVGPLWKGAGWLQAGRIHDGIDLLQSALDRWMALGCRAGVPAWTSMLADRTQWRH